MNGDRLSRFDDFSLPAHGGTDVDGDILDLSISVNPFPLPESAAEAYRLAWQSIGRYPDTGCGSLVGKAAEFTGTPAERLLAANGSAEAFSLVAQTFLGAGAAAMVLPPCYSDYAHVSRLTGASVFEHRLSPDKGFLPEPDALLADIGKNRPELVWLCSPNNPTGTVLPQDLISAAAKAVSEYGGRLVLDEAYASFYSGGGSSEDPAGVCDDSIIRIRSLTKDFGIPGLRLGFIEGPPEIIRVLDLHRPCWSVNATAQAVGEVLFNEISYFEECWKKMASLRTELAAAVTALGMEAVPEPANRCSAFIFCRTPRPEGDGDFFRKMFENGVRIRDCSSMGAPGYCRIGVRTENENRRFLAVLAEVLKGEACR